MTNPDIKLKGLLSAQVESTEARMHRVLDADRKSERFPKRLKRLLIEKQTFTASLVVFTATLILPLLASLQIPCYSVEVASPNSLAREQVSTIAEITSGIAGVLLAVVVFSVQLHAQRDIEAAFMTRYLVRRQLVPWILAFALGFAGFNCVTILIDVIEPVVYWNRVLYIDCVGFPVLLLLTLWFIWRSTRDATEVTFDLGFSLFRSDLVTLVAQDSKLTEINGFYRKALEQLELKEGDIFYRARRSRSDGAKPTAEEFYISGSDRDYIVDINVAPLRALAKELHAICDANPQFSAYILLSPGDAVARYPALVIDVDEERHRHRRGHLRTNLGMEQRTPASELLAEARSLSEEQARDIQSLVDQIFILGPLRDATEINGFFGQFEDRVKELARRGESVAIGRALERYGEILALTIAEHERMGPAKPFALLMRGSVTNPLSSTIHDAIGLGAASGDWATIKEMLSFASRTYFTAIKDEATLVCHWTTGLVSHIYSLLVNKHRKLFDIEEVGYELDRIVDHFLYFECRNHIANSNGDHLGKLYLRERARLDLVVSFVLNMIFTACEQGLDNHASMFLDRLFDYRERRFHTREQVTAATETANSVHDYALIVIVGRSVQRLSQLEEGSPAANAYLRVLRESVTLAPSREEVAATWELYHEHDNDGAIDARLNISHLEERPTARRAGKIYSSSGRSPWQLHGALALMLLRTSDRYVRFANNNISRHTWDLERQQRMLSNLAALPCLAIAEVDRERLLSDVLALIRSRELAAAKSTTKRAFSIQVSQDHADSLIREIRRHWRKSRTKSMRIAKFSGDGEGTLFPLAAVRQWDVPLNDLQPDAKESMYSSQIGQDLAVSESIRLHYSIEVVRQTDVENTHLRNLATEVLNAITALRDRGFVPNLILLPNSYRFLFALLRTPLRDMRHENDLGPVAEWHGCSLLFWPYTDPSSVMVIDSRSFLTKDLSSHSRLDYQFTPPTDERRFELNQLIDQANTIEELPNSDDLRCKVNVKIHPRVGIANINAAHRICLRRSNGLFAMLPQDALYHRPWCPELEEQVEVHLHMLPAIDGDGDGERTPCPTCHPENWDFEAWKGEDDSLGP
jgi:hypothetical protein